VNVWALHVCSLVRQPSSSPVINSSYTAPGKEDEDELIEDDDELIDEEEEDIELDEIEDDEELLDDDILLLDEDMLLLEIELLELEEDELDPPEYVPPLIASISSSWRYRLNRTTSSSNPS